MRIPRSPSADGRCESCSNDCFREAPVLTNVPNNQDPHHLQRFVEAQSRVYDQALAEIRAGQKRSHWMWYIFPQYAGLGSSPTSGEFSIKSIAEATEYLGHGVLGPRLVACTEALLLSGGHSAHQIFGSPDDVKLRSCATLYAHVSPEGSPFHRLLDLFFHGAPDSRTLKLIAGDTSTKSLPGGESGPT